MYFIYTLGPAGSGKSYLTASLKSWLKEHGVDAVAVNLDPAASWLPYTPDIDIREYITIEEVMRKYNLGPNGGLIVAIDLSVEYIDKLVEEIESYKPNYVIVDTPGQMEVFAFRSTGPTIMSMLRGNNKAVSLFLVESLQATKPSVFLSILILSLATLFAHKLPQILIITKTDLIPKSSLAKIKRWIEDPAFILNELGRENSFFAHLYMDITSSLENLIPKFIQDIIDTSSVTNEGLDELYAAIQRILAGGEDFYTEEYSEVL
ncbi:MAG: ATP/GTP-binding protein [Ignisphaera sp.]|uniref:GTPase n=1 Tax=Ignisphaera aggregans TaxID=334771 RepID=A0A7C4NK44_9CREN